MTKSTKSGRFCSPGSPALQLAANRCQRRPSALKNSCHWAPHFSGIDLTTEQMVGAVDSRRVLPGHGRPSDIPPRGECAVAPAPATPENRTHQTHAARLRPASPRSCLNCPIRHPPPSQADASARHGGRHLPFPSRSWRPRVRVLWGCLEVHGALEPPFLLRQIAPTHPLSRPAEPFGLPATRSCLSDRLPFSCITLRDRAFAGDLWCGVDRAPDGGRRRSWSLS